jgi:hypothetical protein
VCADSADEERYGCVQDREIIAARLYVRNDPNIIRLVDAVPCRGDSGGPIQFLPQSRWRGILNQARAVQEQVIGESERWIGGVSSRRIRYQQGGSSDPCGDGGIYAGFDAETISVLERLNTIVWRP